MNNRIKIVLCVLAAGLALSSAFFLFRSRRTAHQNIVAPEDNGAVENIKSVPAPADPGSPADSVSEAVKKIPSAVPILMYHYIRDYSDASDPIGVNLSVSPEKFEEHLAWLKDNGYDTVFPEYFKDPQAEPFKPVILTFDDGYQDAYDAAFPILQKYQLAGIFYLIVGKIGTPGYLTWEEILEMQKAGMAFGSHTLSHPDLKNVTAENLKIEINMSRKALEQGLGGETTDFCYPSGKYDAAVLEELRADGHRTAVTTVSGVSGLKDDPLLLKRLRITEKTDIRLLLENYQD